MYEYIAQMLFISPEQAKGMNIAHFRILNTLNIEYTQSMHFRISNRPFPCILFNAPSQYLHLTHLLNNPLSHLTHFVVLMMMMMIMMMMMMMMMTMI